MADKQKTQLSKANEALKGLSANVTTADRAEAKKKYSEYTVVQYLTGKGKNLDTAMSLLQLFRKRISDRDKAIVSN